MVTAGDVDQSGPGGDERPAVVHAVRRWVALGRDVVVRGEEGSGRSRVLRMLLADASRRGVPAVRVAATGPAPLAALRGHPSVVAERVPVAPGPLSAWLAGELRGRRALLLVDDLDQLDTASAEVVLAALRQSSATLVATTGEDLAGHPDPVVSQLVAERAPAEEDLPPLGFTGVARLLEEALHAPADVALTSSVAARSGGNPRVALALLDAARFRGAAAQVGARWRKVGSLDDVPVDAVAHALLSRLPPAHVAALELLALAGETPVAAAESAVGAATLEALVSRGRLRRYPVAGTEAVVVAPPALAGALRARLGPERRAALARRSVAELAVEPPPAPEHDPLAGEDSERYWQWSADLSALVLERTAAEEQRRRTAWQTAPTPARANAYLDVLLLRRPPAGQVEAVLAGTEVGEGGDDLAQLRLTELRWTAWQGAGPAELDAMLAADPEGSRVARELRAVRRAPLRDPDAPVPEPALPDRLRRWGVVARAAGLLDAGRPNLALRACDAQDPGTVRSEGDHHVDGLRAEAQILLGRVAEAARASRLRLERALDDLDLLGIRVHACMLGEALLLADGPGAAWRVLGASLRLGPGGPLDAPFSRRALALGTVALAQLGATDVAEVLLEELEGTPSAEVAALRALPAVARAALADADGRTPPGDPLWEAGRRYAEQGMTTAALACWLVRPGPYDPERLAVVRRTFAAGHVPLLASSLRLHEALAAGDQDAVVAALPGVPVDVAGLVRGAVASLDAEHVASEAVRALDPRLRPADPEPPQEALTVREREVAALAAAGLTNRQIADRLDLSVRTVENHVSNVLRKLGVPARADLARVLADAAAGGPRA